MNKKKITIGARGSKLALIYAQIAKNKILDLKEKFNISEVFIQKIRTDGDEIQNMRLSDTGGKGLFSKKIEDQLKEKKIDIAVHALKDMPSIETDGLLTQCFLERNDPREVLITKNKKTLKELKDGSVVGTSSYRREFQLNRQNSKLKFKLIRGNVDTRLKKLNDGLYDAIILSLAGIKFLGLEKYISQKFSTSEIIPSVGQGVIALQCRKEDIKIQDILKNINHTNTKTCVEAERNILKVLEGDCETAIGAYAQIKDGKISLEAELFSLDGKRRFYLKSSNEVNSASLLGKEMGKILKEKSENSYKK
ncbi:MAG: hydroxymethylbilane synthase [Candidatus Pelagibacter sp.]